SASDIASAWASVLTAMNSTPWTPASTMRLTALLPPPPTPMILTSVKPRAEEVSGASRICWTTGEGRAGCPFSRCTRLGSKPRGRWPSGLFDTTQHLVRQLHVGVGGAIAAAVAKRRHPGAPGLQDLAVDANFRPEDGG